MSDTTRESEATGAPASQVAAKSGREATGVPASGAAHAAPASEVAGAAARAILDTSLGVMRAIRAQMRASRPVGVSIPQFRALLFVRRRPGTDLSGVAEHLGISLPAASELVARLARKGLVERSVDPSSRRRMRLSLTAMGASQLDAAEACTLRWLADRLAGTDPDRLARISSALADLGDLLLDEREAPAGR